MRPRLRAGRKPGHNMIIRSKGTPGDLAGICLGQARAFLAGVQSPPLRETGTRTRGTSGFKGEMHR